MHNDEFSVPVSGVLTVDMEGDFFDDSITKFFRKGADGELHPINKTTFLFNVFYFINAQSVNTSKYETIKALDKNFVVLQMEKINCKTISKENIIDRLVYELGGWSSVCVFDYYMSNIGTILIGFKRMSD